jgi:hypothetical protein
MKAAFNDFRRVSDPLAIWLDQNVRHLPDGFIIKRGLIDGHNAECVAGHRALMSDKAFGEALRRALPSVKNAQRKIGGQVREVYVGIAWKPKSRV